jgi:hypothetical protein
LPVLNGPPQASASTQLQELRVLPRRLVVQQALQALHAFFEQAQEI